MANTDAGSVDLVITLMDGSTVGITVEPAFVPVIQFMMDKHYAFTTKLLRREGRMVRVVDTAAPKVQMLKDVQLRNPGDIEIMSLKEFEDREAGTLKEQQRGHSLADVLSQMGVQVASEFPPEDDKPTLN